MIIFFQILPAQSYRTDSVVVPNAAYSANFLKTLFFGEHWRNLWTQPVKVEVLNLKEFDGGLIPLKEGGGQQTKSLHLIDSKGKRWKFRSIDKDPSKVLPDYLQESIAEDILQDQISSANPYAPLVLAKLLIALEITQAYPKLVFLPVDDLFGEYKSKFGNILGYIEPHTDDTFLANSNIDGAVKIEDTYDAIEEIEKNFNQKFAAEEFLKARLLDILVGDWDRHMDQWRWIKVKNSSNVVWHPIPRDRDQAFVKFDGILPSIAAYYTPQLNNFGEDYPSIKDLTWNGRFLDSRVLTSLEKSKWDSVTSIVYLKIKDDVIDEAIKALPPEVYDLAKEELSAKLKSRKEKLFEASEEFYKVVNKYTDIFCSRLDDYVEVKRINDNYTSVNVYSKKDFTDTPGTKPYFTKVFDNKITTEIRIFLNDGDDKAIVSGEVDESPVVRIIGGDDKDELIDESKVNGYLLSFTPFPSAETKTYFYDSGKKTEVHSSVSTSYDDSKFDEPKDKIERYEPHQLDKGHRYIPLPIFGYDSDRGLSFGLSVFREQYSFRQIPYANLQKLSAYYSTGIEKFTFTYNGLFNNILKNISLTLLASGTEHYTSRYFGYGNETNYNEELEEKEFYKVDQEIIILRSTFSYQINNTLKGNLGISFSKSKTNLNSIGLLSTAKFKEYGLNHLSSLGLIIGLEYSTVDNTKYPKSGYHLILNSVFHPEIFNQQSDFQKIDFETRAYFMLKPLNSSILALRIGAKKVWGKYPFFESAAIGGRNSLRGYLEKRFSGDASVFTQLELRTILTDVKFIFKSKLGLFAFTEAGRVFAVNESSKKFHTSYGAGVYLSYFDNLLIVNTSIAFSPETNIYSFGLDFPF
ncbi:BamA/TamA family outer membrane protein [Ignavibacterium sp.]|uniref:BamA/TamA family outer membrane protein n=1 Tax=Ignavibacterium sp. TaxID=2651167 RepID=UPI00307DC536